MNTLTLPREAQFDHQRVIIRLHRTDTGTFLLSARSTSGPNIDGLRRAYDRHQEQTAVQAYIGVCHLLADGNTVQAVIDFAAQVAPVVSTRPERLPLACEVAA